MSAKGKRYTKEEKQEVIDFVNQYNDDHNGRGGVANASKKFGITAMTVKAWVDKLTNPTSTPKASRTKKGNIFQQLGDLHDKITTKEAELESLKKQFNVLKIKAKI